MIIYKGVLAPSPPSLVVIPAGTQQVVPNFPILLIQMMRIMMITMITMIIIRGPSKLITVSVVGLSGGEKEKGSMGIGKSCLCNR